MTHNPRGKWERDADAMTPIQAAYRFANEHGPVALIAVAAFALIGWLLVARIDAISSSLTAHVMDTQRTNRASCISLAILAGQPTELCEPQR
jgi:hypothetical protein